MNLDSALIWTWRSQVLCRSRSLPRYFKAAWNFPLRRLLGFKDPLMLHPAFPHSAAAALLWDTKFCCFFCNQTLLQLFQSCVACLLLGSWHWGFLQTWTVLCLHYWCSVLSLYMFGSPKKPYFGLGRSYISCDIIPSTWLAVCYALQFYQPCCASPEPKEKCQYWQLQKQCVTELSSMDA